MTDAPSAFSLKLPTLQLAWDATSMKALQTCPRYYKYSIIDGWRGGEEVHLHFGGFFADAIETYKKSRLAGKSKGEAQLDAVRVAVESSWLDEDEVHEGHPWGGDYEELWRCTGTEKYKNKKGNAAKCPWSHKGKWFPGPIGDTCGECGSPTETQRRYVPENPTKNRHTLVRLVAWYCEEQPDDLKTGFAPFKFPNGQPAVELSFKVPLPWKTKNGETYILAGHLDSIMELGGDEHFISDNKTTKNAITANYWKQYQPNVQVDTYDLAGSLLFPELNIKGVVIEAAQVMVDGARFASQPFYRSEAQREEFYNEFEYWLKQAELFATENYWPMNRINCKICPFQGICSKHPSRREEMLAADFTKKHWNPLEER